jgi:hypothetical protein
MSSYQRISNKDGSVTETMTEEGGVSNQRIISRKFFLKSDINFICQFFYQTEFWLISKRRFETSEAMRILNIRHVISN